MAENPNGNGDSTQGDTGSDGPASTEDRNTGNIRSPEQPQLASAELLSSTEMMDATPMDLPTVEEGEDQAAESRMADEDAPEGPGEGEGVAPGGRPSEAAEQAGDVETQAGFSYPPPYTTHPVIPDYQTYPYRTVGRLFMKTDRGWGSCSASSIGGNAIWTAGHCLHAGNGSTDGWVDKAIFVPAYKDGNAPYGQWPVKSKIVRTAWYRNGSLCEDMGGAILHEKDGQKLHNVVGWLGFAWNWSRVQHWHAMGYPAEGSDFDGQSMMETESSFAYNGSRSCSPQTVAIGSNQTGGCSGGPWIWRFGGGNYVFGHNSYRYTSRPEEMKSPYFGDAAKSLYNALK